MADFFAGCEPDLHLQRQLQGNYPFDSYLLKVDYLYIMGKHFKVEKTEFQV